ncbi:conserved hypothetical protein [Vibrio crassostreae]|uniref:Uncharacterized protein n=1 Tax=Vibrio crassostreae TaxID=246167 RepID=A0A822MY99_9VIBR|nr:conserved hypothetical protein [Vibrio crassostreae]CAK1861325.1 conserved hypothetical protein [Vibrio crassostreae]CAK1861538.1 conserved hypothetical protein [Vibrio crassostreae]CAK1862170.1 conserved hypothetical protein [Vibrio crassostreae]CAK1864140.1 conserved hypothetical protein [Vibrio crassostreae]
MSFIPYITPPILELRYHGAGSVWIVEIEWMIHSKTQKREIQR